MNNSLRWVRFYALATVLLFAESGFSATWNGALLAFQKKATSREALAVARQAFEDLYASRTDARERQRAVEYLVRLDVFAASYYGKSDPEFARAVTEQCWRATVNKFSGLGGPADTASAYWKSSCIGFWAKSFSGLSRLQVVGTMRGEFFPLVRRLESMDEHYLDGGPLRVLAVFHSQRDADRLQSGSYDPTAALALADRALALSTDPHSLSHFLNLGAKALVLQGIGRAQEARTFGRQILASIEAELGHGDSDPENADELAVIAEQIRTETFFQPRRER